MVSGIRAVRSVVTGRVVLFIWWIECTVECTEVIIGDCVGVFDAGVSDVGLLETREASVLVATVDG